MDVFSWEKYGKITYKWRINGKTICFRGDFPVPCFIAGGYRMRELGRCAQKNGIYPYQIYQKWRNELQSFQMEAHGGYGQY
jgi:hypothetical protein